MMEEDKENDQDSIENTNRRKILNYMVFLVIIGVIFAFTFFRGEYILAPPYAVSAYLIVFERKTVYSKKKSIIATYLLVILLSDLSQIIIGTGIAEMILNVVIISAFITFTKMSHPPAIALAIFSFIVSDPVEFTISSLFSLAVLLASSYIIEKLDWA